MVFEGELDASGGAGRFSFLPAPDFGRENGTDRYSLSGEDLFTAAMYDVGRAFLRGLGEVGYSKQPFDDLVAMRIHGATPEFIRELKSLGYDHLSPDDLVAMRIHGVTADFARRAKSRDPGVTIDEVVSMRIHGNR